MYIYIYTYTLGGSSYELLVGYYHPSEIYGMRSFDNYSVGLHILMSTYRLFCLTVVICLIKIVNDT